jgi:nitroimidazol reductase NimA-like FMN-containing flavoprotein (pyridoxamine 5'-phosphate oxidase superfamily)
MDVTKSNLQSMDRTECLALLAGEAVGRLAVTDGRTPMIVPVNYALDGEDIIFRTDPGTKYELGPRARACFEIDHIDRETHTGWSVLATGWLEEVTHYDAARWARVLALPVEPWAAGAKSHRMRLVTERITGRRIGAPSPLR